MLFGPLTPELGVKTPVTVFTPIPDQEPPGNEALNVTGVPLAHSGSTISVIEITG